MPQGRAHLLCTSVALLFVLYLNAYCTFLSLQDETVTLDILIPFEVSVKFVSTKVCFKDDKDFLTLNYDWQITD